MCTLGKLKPRSSGSCACEVTGGTVKSKDTRNPKRVPATTADREGMECQYGSKDLLKTERGRPLIPAESCYIQKGTATHHFVKQ